jgi:hypothetical protein
MTTLSGISSRAWEQRRDLSDHIQIDDAIALWCEAVLAELARLDFKIQ